MEVFPTLHLEGDCKVYMEDVRVDRVVTTRARDLLKVYISCDNIIEKEYIYKVEKELHKQLFSALEGGKEGPEVKLYETFHLSAQYDAPAVFGAYKNSMLLELKEYSPMLHSMLKSAEMSFEADDKVVLTMEDIPLYHQKSGELLQILDKIVCERCGVRAFFEVAYEEPKESKYREEDDIKIARRIAEIAGNRAAISQTSDSEYVDMSLCREQMQKLLNNRRSSRCRKQSLHSRRRKNLKKKVKKTLRASADRAGVRTIRMYCMAMMWKVRSFRWIRSWMKWVRSRYAEKC